MTLSRSEYLAQLGEVAATAGNNMPEIVPPPERHVTFRKMRFRYPDLAAHGEVAHGRH